jgi:hypothetical protein
MSTVSQSLGYIANPHIDWPHLFVPKLGYFCRIRIELDVDNVFITSYGRLIVERVSLALHILPQSRMRHW